MGFNFKCDLCGSSLIPNNIGRIVIKDSEDESVKICKTCNKKGTKKSDKDELFKVV